MNALLHRALLAVTLASALPVRGWSIQDSDATTSPEFQAALRLIEVQLEAERTRLKIPGLSAAVVVDQRTVWSKGFGQADVKKLVAATPQTLYRIGSLTKLFTATMMLRLRDDGKLQLDDALTRHLPEFRPRSRSRELAPITLRQLASHTSGLPTEAPLPYWETLEFPTIEAMLASLDTARFAPPLTSWHYSNLAFALLGEALSRAAGQPYQSYVREHLLQPLGMRHSGFWPPPLTTRAHVATGYVRYREGRPRQVAPSQPLGAMVPAGDLYSSVEDFARFMSLQFRSGQEPAAGAQVVRGSSIREMHTVQWMSPDWQSGSAIGFQLERVADRPAVGHEGGINGFSTYILLVPGEKVGVAVFANTNTSVDALARSSVERLVEVLGRVRARLSPTGTTRAPASWQAYVGVYEHSIGPDIEIRLAGNRLTVASPEAPDGSGQPLVPDSLHRFRMAGEDAGDLVIFEPDPAGRIVRVRVGPYVYARRPEAARR